MRTIQIHDVTLASGETLELELPVRLNEWERPEILVKELPDRIRIGYLAHDDHPEDPLENSVGMGQIHHHPRSRYGRRDSDYFELLGLDGEGEPILDWDKAQGLWRDKVMRLPDSVFELCSAPFAMDADFARMCKEHLADEEVGDYSLEDMVRWAFRGGLNYEGVECRLGDEDLVAFVEAIEPLLAWDWEEVQQEAWIGRQEGVVMLDAYEHGGIAYSITGHGMQCRWDTSSGIAAWAPDATALEEIKRRAVVYDHAYIEETGFTLGRGQKFAMHCGEFVKHSDDWGQLWDLAKEMARLRKAAGAPAQYHGFEIARDEIAGNAVETYNQYVNGDVYGVVTAEYELNGCLISEDSCWGFFGQKWAEDELEERME